ncbi:hypothetical protein CY35_07G036900, partial [Sphagnum magellanicum]
NNNPEFSLCYENGKVLLPNLPATPQELEVFLTSKESNAVKYRDQIRMYNSVLAFTSLGAKVDESVTGGPGPYSFHIQGELYHKIGSLCPAEGQWPQFAQLYIHDMKHERQNRHAVMPSLDPTTLDRLLTMMYNINPYVKVFKMARVAALMVGDGFEVVDRRDRISELHVGYMALHYPLLFPYGEDGWHLNIPLNGVVTDVDLDDDHAEESKLQRKHCNVTMAEFYGYRLQHRDTNGIALLRDAIAAGDNNVVAIGQRIILPSSFTIGPRHMWLEIKRTLLLGHQLQDQPDLELINDIHKKHILGRTIARIYTIARCMMHGPCGATFPNALCMEEGKCKKQYPCKFQSETMTDVNGYPIYRRRDTGHIVVVHGIKLDNRWVVLHNVYLSTKYDAHINVEVCNNIRAVKYLFKYSDNATEGNVVDTDEIKKYLDCRYVSASKAAWHIFKFDMHERFPTVERLQYHLPNQQMVLFRDDDDVQEVATRSAISRTMLTECLMFDQFPQQWVWNRKLKRWTLRKRGFAIGCMYYAHPTSGERYYLRMLLNYVKGATSYEHLRTVDGRVHDTFKYACIAMGLIADDNEWDQALEEAAMTCYERVDPTITLPEDALKDRALYEINQVLMHNGHRLEDFPTLPKSNYIPLVHGGNRLVQEKLAYDRHSLTTNADNAEDRLNDDQRNAYKTVLNAVINKEGKLFFVYGSGGTGKTFVWTTLLSRLQGQSKIVLTKSTCNITQQMKVAELVRKADMIIWDEALMMHRRTFEAVDRTLRDLMQLNDAHATRKIFGGKTVVVGGDFQQILPIVPKHVIILRLHINMRVMATNSEEQREFVEWVLNVGDGSLPTIAREEAPKNTDVDEVNNAILESISEESHTYLNANSLAPTKEGASVVARISMDSLYPVEFLNTLRFNGIANHELQLKVGVPILLLRNLNQSIGLCNGTRLIVKRLGQRVIEAEIITGNNVGKHVFIPRIIMSPSGTDWPFVLHCRQFPIRVAFAIIINKSQGQTFNNVGVYLSSPVYSHGQLYVVISRVTSSVNIKIFNGQDLDKYVRNVIYKEVLEL